LKDCSNSEPAAFPGDFRVHDREQDQIAQFLTQIRVVPGPDGAGHFIRLFDQTRQQ
jgi:hypothetical protein